MGVTGACGYLNHCKLSYLASYTLVNGNKFLVIPPIPANNQLVTNFKEKANNFNDFFNVNLFQTIAPFH